MERRTFIRYVGTLGTVAVLLPDLLSCSGTKGRIQLNKLGAPYERGHLLRGDFSFANECTLKKRKVKTLIVGGGISGLSAAYHLNRKGETDFLLTELSGSAGGNSGYGQNNYSKYPLGAHYLSLANPGNRLLIEFLKEHGLIEKEENGLQWYKEEMLCHAPDERLLFKGVFHDGLVPEYGVDKTVHEEIERFFTEMKVWKTRKSSNGTDLFSIPISQADTSQMPDDLDKITFDEWLDKNNYSSEELRWFLDYCCRDDFGAGSAKVSAWAGLHYFAGRKATPGNTDPTTVLTWPEGNGYLANLLKKPVEDKVMENVLTYEIREEEDKVTVLALDTVRKIRYEIEAGYCICSAPSYVVKHILKSEQWPLAFFDGIRHNPWLIGIVVLSKIPESNGTPLAWDNVKFGTKGLGYVSDRHQEFGQLKDKHVISVYLALDKNDADVERRDLFRMTEEEMCQLVVTELVSMHPKIEEDIESISFQRWGHGMVTPYPGALRKYNDYKTLAAQAKRVHLAHTDYSSYSVFEEGFDLGHLAATKITGK